MDSGIAPAVRAELDQTPEWWDAHYRKLSQKLIPTDLPSHEGHEIEEMWRYTVATPDRYCTSCGGVKLEADYA